MTGLPEATRKQLQQLWRAETQERPHTVYTPILGKLTGLFATSARRALQSRALKVSEVAAGARVPELEARNDGDVPVLLVPGAELLGGLQDRVVNVPVLVMPKSCVRVPVSCVERGRWAFKDLPTGFTVSGRRAPLAVRYRLFSDTRVSLLRRESRIGSQSDVWREVARESRRRGVRSQTEALSEALDASSMEAADWEPKPGQVGGLLVEASGASLEVFGSTTSFEAHGTPRSPAERPAAALDALPGDILSLLAEATWTSHPGVGSGVEHRLNIGGIEAVALCLDGQLVYLSAAAAR